MQRDQLIGAGLLVGSIIVALVYLWLIFLPPAVTVLGMPIDLFVLKLTGAVAVCGVAGIVAWIGYTLATTPPPKPIEEIEKEIEEELKKLEAELKKEEEAKEGKQEQPQVQEQSSSAEQKS